AVEVEADSVVVPAEGRGELDTDVAESDDGDFHDGCSIMVEGDSVQARYRPAMSRDSHGHAANRPVTRAGLLSAFRLQAENVGDVDLEFRSLAGEPRAQFVGAFDARQDARQRRQVVEPAPHGARKEPGP